jgi:formate hydrogenlyase subunit 4
MPNILNLEPLLISLLSPLLIIALSPLYIGVINKFRVRFEAREGASILQPYYDLKKLLVKELIIPEQSSFIFRLSPYLCLTGLIILSLLIPVINISSIFAAYSDLIVIFSLFVLLAFFLVLSSVDAGTAFGGFGASREAFLVSLIEPVVLLILMALSLEFNTINLFSITDANRLGLMAHPNAFFLAIALLIVILAESKRFPVDNPSTHLELTMIHEALLLEYSGKYLAMLEYASMIKLTILSSLFFALFFPAGIADQLSWTGLSVSILIWSIKMTAFGFFIAWFEKSTAKLRLFKIPELLSFALVLSLISVFTHFYIQR